MTPQHAANANTAATLRQALGPGFGLAGPSELLLNAVMPQPAIETASYRR